MDDAGAVVRPVAGPIRLLLVDDHQMVLDGLGAMLRPHAEQAVVVASTTDPDEARRLVVDTAPDIALVDVRMRSMSGLELCQELLRLAPDTKVVLLTVYDDEQYLFEALRAGAAGYLTKQLVAKELLAHLRRVLAGEIVVDPSLAGRVALSASRLQRGEFWPGAHLGLSQRERGGRAHGARHLQPCHRSPSPARGGDDQDPRTVDLPQAGRDRSGPGGRTSSAKASSCERRPGCGPGDRRCS
ncbi:MAG: response regulator transcription factor [Acidimicrobiales bacterium]